MMHTSNATSASNTGTAETGGSSSDMFVDGLDEKADGSLSAKARLSGAFAETREENASKKAFARCESVE